LITNLAEHGRIGNSGGAIAAIAPDSGMMTPTLTGPLGSQPLDAPAPDAPVAEELETRP
jgi:hypothetical protein